MSRNSAVLLRGGRESLKAAGVETYSLDALLLLASAMGKTKEWLLSHDYELSDTELEKYRSHINRREKHEPVQYILRECEFMGLKFYVDRNVLIPRGDTEILAEKLIETSARLARPEILDLCTGSGCVAIAAAHFSPNAVVSASDISPDAVSIAGRNAMANNVSITLQTGDLFEPHKGAVFDIIASNPPYISESELKALPESVISFEPRAALNGGKFGTDFYERIAREAGRHLRRGGRLLLEIGAAQAESVLKILNNNGYCDINIYSDLAGRDRVIEGVWNV